MRIGPEIVILDGETAGVESELWTQERWQTEGLDDTWDKKSHCDKWYG